jgi:hypothetical protein
MWDFSFEYGMDTVSWYAEFALRKRVSMSAMGSVMVIGLQPFLVAVSTSGTCDVVDLPAALGHTGELAGEGHLPEADPAQAELAVHGVGTPAPVAPGVGADGELRLAGRLLDQRGLGHGLSPP